jgi:hypothetical protein
MAEPAVRRMPADGTDQSIGDLVSVAARDVSQLVRYELDLAKIELKADVKRVGIGGALLAIGGFVLCLVLILLCFAFAYGLNALHAPGGLWGSFLWVALACVLLTALAALIGFVMIRKMSGMQKTRRSLSEGLSMLRRRPGAKSAATKASGARAKAQARAG